MNFEEITFLGWTLLGGPPGALQRRREARHGRILPIPRSGELPISSSRSQRSKVASSELCVHGRVTGAASCDLADKHEFYQRCTAIKGALCHQSLTQHPPAQTLPVSRAIPPNTCLPHHSQPTFTDYGRYPQVLVPSFELAGKEHGAVDPIDRQCARAPGGDARAAGRPWSRSVVWSLRVLPPLVAAVWRLQVHGLVAWLCCLAVSMAGPDAWASMGAMEAAAGGCR